MPDIDLPTPGQPPQWGAQLNVAIAAINALVDILNAAWQALPSDITNTETDVGAAVNEAVEAAIASDPTVIAAAVAAAEDAVVELNLISAGDPRIPEILTEDGWASGLISAIGRWVYGGFRDDATFLAFKGFRVGGIDGPVIKGLFSEEFSTGTISPAGYIGEDVLDYNLKKPKQITDAWIDRSADKVTEIASAAVLDFIMNTTFTDDPGMTNSMIDWWIGATVSWDEAERRYLGTSLGEGAEVQFGEMKETPLGWLSRIEVLGYSRENDDHDVPGHVFGGSDRRSLAGFANHDAPGDTFLHCYASDVGTTFGGWGERQSIDIGGLASYWQGFKIASLSDSVQDTYYIYCRRSTSGIPEGFGYIPVSLNQETEDLTALGPWVQITKGDTEVRYMDASSGDINNEIVRLIIGSNPGVATVPELFYVEHHTDTGDIIGKDFAGNVDGTNLPISTATMTATVEAPSSGRRRFFYVRDGINGATPAFLFADSVSSDPYDAVSMNCKLWVLSNNDPETGTWQEYAIGAIGPWFGNRVANGFYVPGPGFSWGQQPGDNRVFLARTEADASRFYEITPVLGDDPIEVILREGPKETPMARPVGVMNDPDRMFYNVLLSYPETGFVGAQGYTGSIYTGE